MRLFDAHMRIPKSRIIILLTGLNTQPDRTLFFLIFACEVVYLIEVLEKMAKMRPYIILLSLKPIKMSSDFVLNYWKKLYGAPPLK